MVGGVVWQQGSVSQQQRETLNGHKGAVVWFTGLSGAGKTTLAYAIEQRLHQMGVRTFVLDGDNVRHGLCADLDFSSAARTENVRRVGELAKLFMEAGVIAMAAFISPFRADRERVRTMVPSGRFVEVYCNTPLELCELRDTKGLYKKARAGKISDFTGISSPYEPPFAPDVEVDTGKGDLDHCVEIVIQRLEFHGLLRA